jgi:hypothetical protein
MVAHTFLVDLLFVGRVVVFFLAMYFTFQFIAKVVVSIVSQMFDIYIYKKHSISIGWTFLYGIPVLWTLFLILMLTKI